MGVHTQQDRARERARALMWHLNSDDVAGMAGAAADLVTDEGADRELFFPVLVEITTACAQLIEASASISGPDTAYVMDLAAQDGSDVAIDELPAALRAVLRAILARLEQQHDDQQWQLDMAVRDPELRGRIDALTHGLECLAGLTATSSAPDSLPSWLRR